MRGTFPPDVDQNVATGHRTLIHQYKEVSMIDMIGTDTYVPIMSGLSGWPCWRGRTFSVTSRLVDSVAAPFRYISQVAMLLAIYNAILHIGDTSQ